ncbi:MAG TPA: efflux transporter outer membrane subunit [Pyrinomonadaceae bacterium]|jgi:multidrug efflux system outer membrane protein
MFSHKNITLELERNASAGVNRPSEPANFSILSTIGKSVVSLLLVVSTLTSVVAQDKYPTPTVLTPEHFRSGEPGPTAEQNSIGDLKWFEVFKDPDLQSLVRTAMIQNYDLRAAVERINAARANLGLARSEQFPQFEASTDLTTTRNSRNGQFTSNGQANRSRSFGSVFLNLLNFELDIWGRLRQQTKAARAELRASEADRKAVMTIVVSDVATGYFSLLELDNELDIAKRTLAAREESLLLIKLQQQGGVSTMLEVREAEQLVLQASETIPNTQRLIEQTENQISFLLGNNPGPIRRGRSLAQQEELPAVPPGLPSMLLERRPDIKAAEENLVAQRALVSAARKAYFPRISLTGLLGFQSNQLSSLFTQPSGVWSFVPQITQPIFTAGRLKSGVKSAQAQRELAVVQYQATIQNAFREVSDALIAYQKVKEIRTQQEQLVATLRDRSHLAYLRYKGGVDTLLNALDADRDLFNAELDLAQTKRNELLSLVQLYKALGGGWQQ